MRGSLVQRYPGRWSLILDLGYQTDPVSGTRKRKQQWITFHGTREAAEKALTKLVGKVHDHEFVSPDKITVGEWLDSWCDLAIKPPLRAQRTYENYRGIIKKHFKPALGAIRLQDLQAVHLERFNAESAKKGLSARTIRKHHTMLSTALKTAVRKKMVSRNVASDVDNVPRAQKEHPDVEANCWEVHEAAQFLKTAEAAGPQQAAFYTLALEAGLRKSELCGLMWSDLTAGKLKVSRQLLRHTRGTPPTFGPLKNRTSRVVELSTATLALLKTHRQHQAEVKLANRTQYHDHGLVFAREWADPSVTGGTLGDPLQAASIGQREFDGLIKAAGVRRIKFHGLRHTAATVALKTGVPAHVVKKRLGHQRIEITLDIYAHCFDRDQHEAAESVSAVLHG